MRGMDDTMSLISRHCGIVKGGGDPRGALSLGVREGRRAVVVGDWIDYGTQIASVSRRLFDMNEDRQSEHG